MNAQDEKLKHPRFGEWVRGNFAGEANPQRDGMFVRVVRTMGRLNPGTWYELTDGKGHFWQYEAKNTTRIAALAAPKEAGDDHWHLATMNDGLFIINAPPRPSTDDAWHDRPDGPTLVLNVNGLPQGRAQEVVAAHNAALDNNPKPGCITARLAAPSKEAGPSGYKPIERDEDFDREYLPLPGGWEIQTKGKGSTFRICDPEGNRLPIPDSPYLHDTLMHLGRQVNAAWKAANPPGDQRQEGECDCAAWGDPKLTHHATCPQPASPPTEAAAAVGDPVVGHKTHIDDAGRFYHTPLRQSEANELLAQVERDRQERERLMPDETTAINLMWSAWYRLKDFGWREACYCPKDGSDFDVIEAGSTGIHRTSYYGTWPTGGYIDVSTPVLFRAALSPTASAAREGS